MDDLVCSFNKGKKTGIKLFISDFFKSNIKDFNINSLPRVLLFFKIKTISLLKVIYLSAILCGSNDYIQIARSCYSKSENEDCEPSNAKYYARF